MANLPPGNAESPTRKMLDETNGTLLPRKARAAHYFIGLNPPLGRSNTWINPRGAATSGFHTWRAASARSVWEPPRNFTGIPTATRRVQSFVRQEE